MKFKIEICEYGNEKETVKANDILEAELPTIGEGVVYHSEEEGFTDSRFWFKVKGEKHSASKVKTLVPVDPVKHANINAFVDSVVTKNRLEQGVQSIIEQNALNPENVFDNKNIGHFLKWINKDILKEEQEGIANCGASDFKEIAPVIARKAREWFMAQIQ